MEGNGNNNQQERRENPSPREGDQDEAAPREQQAPSGRTPFANLSQVDADLALARTLQEQERAYLMLTMRDGGGGGYSGWEGGSYFYVDDDDDEEDEEEDDEFGNPETENDEVERSNNTNNNDNNSNNDGSGERNVNNSEEDKENDNVHAFDAHVHDDEEEEGEDLGVEFDPAVFTSDEAYARALQDAEEREMAARLFALAGIHDLVSEVQVPEDLGDNSQDWEEVDPDELSYEELLALGEVVGTESRGLSADTIASLPSVNYKAGSSQNGRNDSCVICHLDYEDDETLTLLSCKHSYHPECLNNWLKINKVCPVCSTEVSSSGHS